MQDSAVIHVVVKPGARETVITRTDDDGTMHISLKAQPQDGKANAELERFLSKTYACRATIRSGHTSRRKTVLLEPR
jgi:uncharacterized protein (TIGR00251 family)